MKRLHETAGLCPRCLRRVPAFYEEDCEGAVFLKRTCPEHGTYSAMVWPSRREAPDIGAFSDWSILKTPAYPEHPLTMVRNGCPFDCGLCPAHAQHTCHGLIELTMRCNLSCPVCYASAGGKDIPADTPREVVSRQLKTLQMVSGDCNLQLSGGEPTLRDDLPAIIREAKSLEFGLVQVNSNGVRLGTEAGYAEKLADAGLDSVYLQWDTLQPRTSLSLRGTRVADLPEVKIKAVEACSRAGLGVVLVATVVRGVNDGELGELLRDAVARGPVVRGLHIQPASFFGRSPWGVLQAPRLTLGHVMQALSAQAPEWVKASDFHPPHCEHSLCSFSAVYLRKEGNLCRVQEPFGFSSSCNGAVSAAEGSRVAKAFIARQWNRPPGSELPGPVCCAVVSKAESDGRKRPAARGNPAGTVSDDFSRFLVRKNAESRFTLSGMAFQDALSLDIERLRGCCIHVVRPDGRIIPFCAQNMTSIDGVPLYPGRLECTPFSSAKEGASAVK